MKKLVVCLVSLACLSSPGSTRTGDVTISSSVSPVFRDGELQGCTLVFDAAHRDFEHLKGDLVHLAGSLNFNVFPNRAPYFSMKLGVQSLKKKDAPFVAPADIYLLKGTETNKANRLGSVDGEMKGFRLVAFAAEGATLDSAMAIAEDGMFHFGYSMSGGGMLSPVEIDVRTQQLDLDRPERSKVNAKAPSAWLDCITRATERALANGETK